MSNPITLLSILQGELDREFQVLKVKADPPPYFLAYEVTEEQADPISASLGALIENVHSDQRGFDTTIRVASPKFDNDHPYQGTPVRFTTFTPVSLDDNSNQIRRALWAESDQVYRAASRRYLQLKTDSQLLAQEERSNGHRRLPGPFGSKAAAFGNLFIETSQPVTEAQLKRKLIERAQSAGLKYGLLIRRLDFPSTDSLSELQSMARQLQKSGFLRTVSQPLLAYRVFADGHEELVRGLRFGEFSAKDLRDIAAASDRPYVLNYVNTGSSWNVADLRTEVTTSSVICPSLLFESVELTRAENEAGAQPVVPPPSLVARQ